MRFPTVTLRRLPLGYWVGAVAHAVTRGINAIPASKIALGLDYCGCGHSYLHFKNATAAALGYVVVLGYDGPSYCVDSSSHHPQSAVASIKPPLSGWVTGRVTACKIAIEHP